MSDPTHRVFLDDSGDKDYTRDNKYGPIGVGPTPYFVFGGLILSPTEANGVEQAMRTLKQSTFGTPEVEIKANWLKRPMERTKRYIDKYGVTESELTEFVDQVYELINEVSCQLIACIVNKAETKQLYGNKAHHPASIAYDCLLQRIQQEMASCGGGANMTIDAMTGATPAGNPHLTLLNNQHKLLKKQGSNLQRGMAFDRIGGVKFGDSKLDERLQLADLVAYAVYRQFVDHGTDWENPGKQTLPVYEYLGRIASKFRQDNSGRIQGYGIIKFPTMSKRMKWTITE